MLEGSTIEAVQQSRNVRKRKINRALNTKRSDFFALKINCGTASKEYKRGFTNQFNGRRKAIFRRIIRGDEYKMGPIETEEELKNLLKEYERYFWQLGVKIPSLDMLRDYLGDKR